MIMMMIIYLIQIATVIILITYEHNIKEILKRPRHISFIMLYQYKQNKRKKNDNTDKGTKKRR
jgi:hypothetical protein